MSKLGIAGSLAKHFQNNQLTPLFALLGLILGVFAVLVTPREEEPQIDVTMANVFVPFAGADVNEVEKQLAYPLEQILSEIEGVRHVYSVSRAGIAVFTVEFEVGEKRADAVLRVYNAVFSNNDWAKANPNIGPALVKPMGIDDVPVMSVTLWSDNPQTTRSDLVAVAHGLESEIKRIAGTRDVVSIGAADRAVIVELDSAKLASYAIDASAIANAIRAANQTLYGGELVGNNQLQTLSAGSPIRSSDELANVVIAYREAGAVYLRDVANIKLDDDQPTQMVWYGAPATQANAPASGTASAITIAIAKKPGVNAVDVTAAIEAQLEAAENYLIPDGVNYQITRNYGVTANDKAQQLITKLAFATLSVVLLVWLTLGWREAVVVAAAVVITLALTLFASWAFGFTINRVSLFALIFSIGILVDDAIVVVENIHRRQQLSNDSLLTIIPLAVDEVGSPTILATFTVVAALLPMAFVSGLMGPYMSPIPINASAGMVISLLIAFVVTPWLAYRLFAHHQASTEQESRLNQFLDSFFNRVMARYVDSESGARSRQKLYLSIGAALLASVLLVVFQAVVLKMLPFDNKSEFQVVVDLPEGSSLEATDALLRELAEVLETVPEVENYQAYVGTSAPVNFNGLVRQYYLREGANVGDLQVNLVDKGHRNRSSHEIASAVRPQLSALARAYGASLKVVEVPPGPPVMSPLMLEVYGPDAQSIAEKVSDIENHFSATVEVVDIDSSLVAQAVHQRLQIDRDKAAKQGIDQTQILAAIEIAAQGKDIGVLHDGVSKYGVPIRLRVSAAERADVSASLAMNITTASGEMVALSELITPIAENQTGAIYHKDILPFQFVSADVSGDNDSPLYAMFNIASRLSEAEASKDISQYYINKPTTSQQSFFVWEGEWRITYETFRDMGIAYAAGLILIYLLVVAQFRSYLVPLIIMVPIPLTAIGVMPGHALLGAQFTATSMIGMIALAGIIVRNSILLVDFINHEITAGSDIQTAVIRAGAVRAKPIALTALAAMMGAMFILDDPIFNGLAVSLIFGIFISTLLTLVVIPVLYFVYLKSKVRV